MYQLDFNKPCHVYFCGIGGISMVGLAEILLSRGFKVSGSDMKESELTKILAEKGAEIHIGQRAENVTSDTDLFVYTAAIGKDNPEWIAKENLNLSSLSRAELLGQIMKNFKLPIAVSGTHGKTTTHFHDNRDTRASRYRPHSIRRRNAKEHRREPKDRSFGLFLNGSL